MEWAEAIGWMPVTEMPLAFLVDTEERPGRQGIVDIYIARSGYRRDLVIEIDSTNKTWSAQKLGRAVANGKAAIWVRWGSGIGPAADVVPVGVEVIYLDVGRPPRVQPATPGEDLRLVPVGSTLSGASRVLLAALFPQGPPQEDSAWTDEKSIWEMVGQLRPRLALVIRCRFGHHGPRALTLNKTAEVLADELDEDEVTRERVRQLQIKAIRSLRSKSAARVRSARRAAGLLPPVPERTPREPRTPASRWQPPDQATLRALVLDVVRAIGPGDIRPSMVCHVLRGSVGPATRRIVAEHALPHDGAVGRADYRALLEAVVRVAAEAPFRLDHGYLRLAEPC
jgi:hypothetical protein